MCACADVCVTESEMHMWDHLFMVGYIFIYVVVMGWLFPPLSGACVCSVAACVCVCVCVCLCVCVYTDRLAGVS